MNNKKYTNQITGLVVMVLGIAYYIQSFSIRITRVGGDYNSRMFPQLIAIVCVFMGLLLALRNVRSIFRRNESMQNVQSGSNNKETLWARNKKVIFIFLISFAYVGLMMIFGYLVTTPIFMFAFIGILTPKAVRHRFVFNAILSLVSTLLFYLMFRYGFTMILPRGMF